MNNLLHEYFDFNYSINDDEVTKVSIKIKPSKLSNIKSKSNGATVNWYIDKFGNELGNSLYDIRKSYNSSNEIINYLLKTDISDRDKTLLEKYKNDKNQKRKLSNIERYANPTFKSEFKKIMNKKDRVSTISKSSKKMWSDAKTKNKELYYRMVNTVKYKNYVIDGINMNFIEYQVAIILNKLNINWEYEKIFVMGNHTYIPDFWCKEHNLIIECYGDFWHANPKTIGDRKYTHKNRLVEDVRNYDNTKMKTFIDNGYNFLYIWEYDIIHDINNIKTIIKNNI